MPHLGEDCWAVLGHKKMLADTSWPQTDASLLIEDNVIVPVQVNGKRRDEISIAKGAPNKDVEELALGLDSIKRAIGEKTVRKVIVVPDRIVNVVIG